MFKSSLYLINVCYAVPVGDIMVSTEGYILVKTRKEDQIEEKVKKYIKSINGEYKWHFLKPTL